PVPRHQPRDRQIAHRGERRRHLVPLDRLAQLKRNIVTLRESQPHPARRRQRALRILLIGRKHIGRVEKNGVFFTDGIVYVTASCPTSCVVPSVITSPGAPDGSTEKLGRVATGN